jgi:hypothetical protein
MSPDLCAMCHAPDCQGPRPCSTYTALRDSLLPIRQNLTGDAALALLWLARQLGRTPRLERKWAVHDLLSLFSLARQAAFHAAELAPIELPHGAREALTRTLHSVLLTRDEQRTLAWLQACDDATLENVISIMSKARAWLLRGATAH